MDTHTVNISGPNLPAGFRFHPTDQELIFHYLKNKVLSSPNRSVSIIADVDIYKFNPWELPGMTWFGDKEWFFFSPRDRKYPNGGRPNRAAGSGYWKATGTDKPIISSSGAQCLGVKKALVFYQGRPPKGVKTNWVMLEYRLIDNKFQSQRLSGSMRLDDWVLCRIRQKIKTPQHMKEHYDANCSSSPFTFGYLQGQEIVNKNAANCSSSPLTFGYLQGQEIVNKKAATEAYHYNQFEDYLTTPLEMEEANEQGQEASNIGSPDYSVSDFDSNHPTVTSINREVLESIKKVLSIGALDELVPLPTIASTFYEENGSNFQDSSPTTSTSNPLCFAEFTI